MGMFFQPKILKEVADRTSKDLNVVLRFVGPHKGTSTAARATQTSTEALFASCFDFWPLGLLMSFLTAVFFQPKVLKEVADRTSKNRNVVLRLVGPPKGTDTIARHPNKSRSTVRELF